MTAFKWWSVRNWMHGYKFGPIQRFRCCDHTTPYHYRGCRNHAVHSPRSNDA